ncbi:MAG: peptidoglycan DD-metalloendopeptidase family protein [Caulobacteraceae bacterium]
MILGIGGGYHLVLAGLDRVEGPAGRTVAAGEPLGAMAAEAASPPELYLEVRKDGAPQDPGRWLKARGGDGR